MTTALLLLLHRARSGEESNYQIRFCQTVRLPKDLGRPVGKVIVHESINVPSGIDEAYRLSSWLSSDEVSWWIRAIFKPKNSVRDVFTFVRYIFSRKSFRVVDRDGSGKIFGMISLV